MVQTKSIFQKAAFVLKISLYTLLSGVLIYFAVAILFSFLPTHYPERNCPPAKEIYLNTNGIHVDLIIPAEYIEPSFNHQLDFPAATRFIAFGWGDRSFYIHTPEWSDLTFPVAFKALFLKSPAAMHVTSYRGKMNSWKSLKLCDNQLKIILDYIENSFEKDDKGRIKKMDFEGYNYNDSFFEAKGSFSLFNTCNVWVNRALKNAEVKTAVWTPFDFGILYHIK